MRVSPAYPAGDDPEQALRCEHPYDDVFAQAVAEHPLGDECPLYRRERLREGLPDAEMPCANMSFDVAGDFEDLLVAVGRARIRPVAVDDREHFLCVEPRPAGRGGRAATASRRSLCRRLVTPSFPVCVWLQKLTLPCAHFIVPVASSGR